MKRPTSSSRKINENTHRLTIPQSKLEDSKMQKGDWAEVKLITTGRNAGCILIQPPQKQDD